MIMNIMAFFSYCMHAHTHTHIHAEQQTPQNNLKSQQDNKRPGTGCCKACDHSPTNEGETIRA